MNSTETEPNTPNIAYLLIDLGITVALSYVAVMDETQLRALTMRILRASETFCQGQAVAWARAADMCKTAYDRARMVS